jgi:hypothetical protein
VSALHKRFGNSTKRVRRCPTVFNCVCFLQHYNNKFYVKIPMRGTSPGSVVRKSTQGKAVANFLSCGKNTLQRKKIHMMRNYAENEEGHDKAL